MALMMIIKKTDELPSGAELYVRICPIAKEKSGKRAFIKKHFSFTKHCWLCIKSLTDALK